MREQHVGAVGVAQYFELLPARHEGVGIPTACGLTITRAPVILKLRAPGGGVK
jgi:hypothetical protein